MIDFPTDVAPSDVVSTTTILARLFLEPDAARATSTPSHELNLAARIREAHFELKPRWRLAAPGTLLLGERRGRVLAVEGLSLEGLIADHAADK
jgi:hypothetical protein